MQQLPLENIDIEAQIIQEIIWTLVVLVVAFALVKLGQRLIPRYIDEPARRYKLSKALGRTGTLAALVVIGVIWSPELPGLWTILTVIGAGLAIAMREVLLSFFGWTNLTLRAPYAQGDRIEVNGVRGDVIDIRVLHTTLMEIGNWVDADQSTGRLVHVPNSWVYQHAVYNYSRGFNFIWNEIRMTVTFRSDWQAAREIMLSKAQESSQIVERQVKQQIRQMSREYLVHYSILTPFVYVRVVENGTRLSLRYLCEVRKRRGTEHALTMSILAAFEEHGRIEMAYPTVGVYEYGPSQFAPPPDTRGDASPAARRDRT